MTGAPGQQIQADDITALLSTLENMAAPFFVIIVNAFIIGKQKTNAMPVF